MRIEREDQDHVGSVWAVASEGEAYELLEALVLYFCPDDGRELLELIWAARKPDDVPSWHAHVGEPDELTITLEPG